MMFAHGFRSKFTQSTDQERNRKSDVRDIDKFLPKPLDFNPLDYFDEKKAIFVGLDENKKPVCIDMGNNNSAPHIQVVGTTGAGKGVSLGVLASQFLARDEAVFFCDPKNDEWAPHVLYDVAKQMGKPFHFINLNSPNGPQINIFQGATKEEIYELFLGGFSLSERGGSADFYSIDDRLAGEICSNSIAAGGTVAACFARHGEELEQLAKKFWGKLREIAGIASINASNAGVDFEKIVADGGCVYIVGSMRNDVIKTIQRMLLVRFIQLAERRDRMSGPMRPVCVVLDEVKYHISRPALEGLGAARDKGVHLLLAHQSLGDLEDCPQDINPRAVVDGVVENCRIKIAYRVQNPTTAKWLAEMSGKILVDDESRTVARNIALAERVEGTRSIRQAEAFYIDENILQNLKPSTCVLYGQGLPKRLTIKPLRTKKAREAVTINVVQGDVTLRAAEALSLDQPEQTPISSPIAAPVAAVAALDEQTGPEYTPPAKAKANLDLD